MQLNLEEKMDNYIQKIRQLAHQLNNLPLQTNHEQFCQLLAKLINVDQQFMSLNGIQCKGHLLFSRHGQSNNWGQKAFGILPKSQISEEAILAMENTQKLTKSLLIYPQIMPVVRVSPMIRAKQTAGLLLPSSLKYDIKIETCLSQNSSRPSGAFVLSHQHLKNIYEKTSLAQNPKKVIYFKLSEIFYGSNQFYQKLQSISSQADDKLLKLTHEQKVQNYYGSKFNHKSEEYSKQLQKQTKESKVQGIKNIIQQSFSDKVCDLWFFGHSENLKGFFMTILCDEQQFQFGETRRVYKIINKKGQKHYFNPPYKFIIDQLNGKISVIELRNSSHISEIID